MAENVLVDIERKWQRIWEEKVRWEAERDETREKFFLIFAYPGISGYLHVGHMRGFTYADVICRYKRQRGYSVLFPVGFHASGLPAISLAKRIQRGDPSTIEYLKRNSEVISRLSISRSNIEEIMNLEGLQIVEVPAHLFKKAVEISWKYGLLATDALLVATMRHYGIKKIATFDKDFERVDFLKLWKP